MKKITKKLIKSTEDKVVAGAMTWVNNNLESIEKMERMFFRSYFLKQHPKLTPEKEFMIECMLYGDKLF